MFGIKNDSKIIRFKHPETKIGRNRANHVILAKSLKISRFHAVIRFFDSVPFIKDVSVNENSEWGVYINKTALLKNRWCELKVGDTVAFGAPTIDENGCLTEIVDLEPEQEEYPAGLNDIATQAPVPSTLNNNHQEHIFDLTADDIIHIEDDGHIVQNGNNTTPKSSPIPPSPTKVPENSKSDFCISLCDDDDDDNDEDDDVIFSSPTRLVTTSQVINNAEKPVQTNAVRKPLDVTLTMNGLLKQAPSEFRPPPPPPVPLSPAMRHPDEIENQLAAILEPSTLHNSSSMINESDFKQVMPYKQPPIVKQEFPFQDTQELRNVLNYSMPDEIISLDSDEEDFPSSQLNTTAVIDVPDYSSSFSMMYELKSEVPSDDEDIKFICDDSWFGPLSQTIEDVKPGLSKGLRKPDLGEISLDAVDASHNEIENVESSSVSSSTSAFNETVKPIPSKLASKNEPSKIMLIPPQPVSKKRRSGDTAEYRKKKKHRRVSSDSTNERLSKIKSPSKKLEYVSDRSSSLSSKQEKRERVKKLYKDRPPEVTKKIKEHKVTPKVKNTDKNRGAFLTNLESSSSTASPSAKKMLTEVSKSESGGVVKKCTKNELDDGTVIREQTESVHERKIPGTVKISVVPQKNLTDKVTFSTIEDASFSKTLLPKLPITASSWKIISKSILKKSIEAKSVYQNGNQSGRSKKVKFPDQIISGCKEIDVDYEVSKLSQFKKFELLIRKCSIEFDQALGVILSWNVKWLQEQQKHVEPPPLYPTAYQNGHISDTIENYKEELKYSMFHSIWKNIFANWNIPNNDNFPLTQVPVGGQVSDYYTIEIEKVEGSPKSSPNSLLTIHAKREILFFQAPDVTICSGKLAIMNFHITKPPAENSVKTMVFAYIQSYNRCSDEGGHVFDRIILKIFAKPFHIVRGEAKMKVLNYARQFLKQFQALGMTRSCPIIKPICDVNFHDSFSVTNVTEIKSKEINKLSIFGEAQQRAVITSLNCLTKDSSVSFIDGPCGTGKTQVIVSLLREFFSLNENRDTKVLVITINDKLADDLVYRMCKDELSKNVLRFGFCGGLNNSVKHCALDSKIQEIVKTENLINIEDEIKIMRAKLQCNKLLAEGRRKPEDIAARIKQCEQEIEDLQGENSRTANHMQLQIAKEKALGAANIVVTAYGTCWSSNFENNFVPNNLNKGDINEFKICIIDDANFLDENSMLIPQMLQVKHLILVGDRKVKSYQKSSYHKMLHYYNLNNKNFVSNLDTNYRMCPEVLNWVQKYYDLKIDSKKSTKKRRIKLKPFLIIDHTSSKVVNYQTNLCEKLAKCILEMDSEKLNFSVSVMVPTNSDKENLRAALNTSMQNRIRVDFFDGFSTRENDVIVLCLPASQIHDQWLYIAVTRAKSTLIICGDFEAIQPMPAIMSLLNYAKEKKVYFSLRKDHILPEELKSILES